MSESESSSESVSELEEISDEELLAWLTGPLPFSSEALERIKRGDDVTSTSILGTAAIIPFL